MTDTVGQPVIVSPSPRHMRKRRLLGDISASQLPQSHGIERVIPVSGPVNRLPDNKNRPAREPLAPSPSLPSNARPLMRTSPFKKASLRQKRVIALATVILVSLSIPILILTLMFGI